MVAEGTYTDREAVEDVVRRVTDHVEQNLPETLARECYLDPNGTHATFFEEFTDESALAAYEGDMAGWACATR